MKIKVTKDGGWHTGRIGEVFDVRTVKNATHQGKTYTTFEVDLVGRDLERGAFAGSISADECEVVDWTDAPPSMEIDRLRTELASLRQQVATLTAKRDALAAASDCANGNCYCHTLAAQRDALAAQVAELQACVEAGWSDPQGMTPAQSRQIYARHGLTWASSHAEVALALGGLEAELAAKLVKLEALVKDASDIIEAGVELMSLEQLSEWRGHGAWLHVAGCPVTTSTPGADT